MVLIIFHIFQSEAECQWLSGNTGTVYSYALQFPEAMLVNVAMHIGWETTVNIIGDSTYIANTTYVKCLTNANGIVLFMLIALGF